MADLLSAKILVNKVLEEIQLGFQILNISVDLKVKHLKADQFPPRPKSQNTLCQNGQEPNQRKKDLELAVKNLVEENKQIKATLQEFLKNYPKLIQEMVKESTNYIVNNLNKSVEKCHAELIQKTLGQHQELKDQNDNQLFEVLAVITATKETLLAKSGIDPKAIMTSLDEMKELVSKQIVNKNEFKPKNLNEKLCP